MKRILFLLFILAIAGGGYAAFARTQPGAVTGSTDNVGQLEEPLNITHPLTIESLRKGVYPGSELLVEETLANGSNYRRYIVSYQSEGNKNYALLTVPLAAPPDGGYPAIIFNHGYIRPDEYRTTERYIAYVDGFARSGYVVLRPDYRGHGSSEGVAAGAYGSNAYTIDVLNAVASLKKRPDINPGKIGMWGHSMGGFITLRVMVTTKDVKGGVIWGGVVGSYEDMLNNWRRRPSGAPNPSVTGFRGWRQSLSEQYGAPEKNPSFWDSISATGYLSDISGPVELHHSDTDESVPVLFSRKLEERMKSAGKPVTLFEYEGDDHNISRNFSLAMSRSVKFFDTLLK